MNRIVRRHYPVEKLPADVREELGSLTDGYVTLTVEEELARFDPDEFLRLREEILAAGEGEEDPVGRVRALRDEWEVEAG